jgi:uncharacterized RDD family membrane protein YckC
MICDIVCVYFPTVILYVFINLLWYCMCLFSYSDLVCVYFPTVILYVYIFLQWYFYFWNDLESGLLAKTSKMNVLLETATW